MNEPKVAILAVAAAALLVPAPRGLAAQIVSKVEAGQFTVSDGVFPLSALRVAPSLQFDLPHAKFKVRGAAFLSEQGGLQLADGIVSGTFTSPTVYGVRAEMIGNASRAVDDRSLGNDQIDVQTRVHVDFRHRGGLWFGSGVARPWRVGVVSSADVADAGAWARLGDAARAFGVATFTGTFTNFSFTKVASIHDTGTVSLSCSNMPAAAAPTTGSIRALFNQTPAATACERQSRFGDLEGSLHWDLGALELTAQMGHRFGDAYDVADDSRRWTSAMGTIWFNERIALIAGGGRQPALPLRGIPSRSYAMAGFEVAYRPMSKSSVPVSLPHSPLVKSFDHHAGATGMQKIIIRVGGVETVDVMGDFSDWLPLTLVRRGRDLWELSIPMSPGMHQINIRVDRGAWTAPPNLPTTKDGYNGEVGLMVVGAEKGGH